MALPSTPEKSPSKDMFETIIDVTVGPAQGPSIAKKSFKVHKGVLCFYSGYFDRALKSNFEEARKGAFTLPEESVTTFERFVLWLYTRKVDYNEDIKSYGELIQLWAFADRREVPLLMNACLDAMRDKYVSKWQVPDEADIRKIYKHTAPSSGLRRFVIHVIGKTCPFDNYQFPWPSDALRDMLIFKCKNNRFEGWNKNDLAEMDMCDFHEHETAVTCSKKRKYEQS